MTPYGAAPAALTVERLRLTYLAERSGWLPAPLGSTLRGALGAALRAVSCITGAATCDGCVFRAMGCAYGRLWETRLDPGEYPKRLAHAPAPYVVRPLAPGGRIQRGRTVAFEVRLFGVARAFVPQIVDAAAGLGAAGLGEPRLLLRLVEVERLRPESPSLPLREHGAVCSAGPAAWEVSPTPRRTDGPVRVALRSPLSIKRDQRVLTRFDPVALTLRLLGRLGALARVHEGQAVSWDIDGLRRRAEQVTVTEERLHRDDWKRRSRRSGRVPMRGITGEVTVAGVDDVLAGLWACGPAVGVGKNAVMGLGHIELDDGRGQFAPEWRQGAEASAGDGDSGRAARGEEVPRVDAW